jgi:TatD DNase family protein
MKLVDTHCHLDMPEFGDDLDAVLDRARSAGVERIIVPGIDAESSKKAVLLAGKHENIFAAVGIHPHYADRISERDVDEIRYLATSSDKVVAIGEIGMDNYRGTSAREQQKDLFTRLLSLASELDLPAIVHSREAFSDVFEVLGSARKPFLRGVMHCFSGDGEDLRKILSLGLLVSFAGNITFPKAQKLRETAALAGIEKILLETDAPYMAPQAHRGERNEPAFIGSLAGLYGDIFGIDPDAAASATSSNADRLFRLGLSGGGKIAYKIRNSMYINMTYRCSNRCVFCARQVSTNVKGHELHLGVEPRREDIMRAIGDPKDHDEVVFCGFGEPTLRWGALKEVAMYIKKKGGKVRINTNGEANLINGRDVTGELEGLADNVSVSINAPECEMYDELCKSVFGKRAHKGIKEFISGCVSRGIKVEVTCLDSIGEEAVASCRALGESLGAGFRLRHMNEVG